MKTLNAAFAFVSSLVFCMSTMAYDFGDLLSLNHDIETYSFTPVKKQSRSIASTPSLHLDKKKRPSPLIDKGVNIDLNGNGVDDTWKSIKGGRLVSLKSDLNEDGTIDIRSEYDELGRETKHLRDTNYDGSFDVKKKCENQTCVTLVDKNFDGKFDTKLVEDHILMVKKIFSKRQGSWIKLNQLKLSHTAAQTEGKYINCDGNCDTAVSGDYSYETHLDLKDLRDKISQEFSRKAPPKISVDGGGFFQATNEYGILVHSSCHSEDEKTGQKVSFEIFKARVDEALDDFRECSEKLKKFSDRKDGGERYNNFSRNILFGFTNLLNPTRPQAFKPKIACVDMVGNNDSQITATGSLHMKNSTWDSSIKSGQVLGTLLGPPYVSFKNEAVFVYNTINGRIKSTILHELCHNLGYSHDTLPDYCSAVAGFMDACREVPDYDKLIKSRKFKAAYNQITRNEFHSFADLEPYNYFGKDLEGYLAARMYFSDFNQIAPENDYYKINQFMRYINESGANTETFIRVAEDTDGTPKLAKKNKGNEDNGLENIAMSDKPLKNGLKAVLENSDPSKLTGPVEKIYYHLFKDNALDLDKPEVEALKRLVSGDLSSATNEKNNGLTDSRNASITKRKDEEEVRRLRVYLKGLFMMFEINTN